MGAPAGNTAPGLQEPVHSILTLQVCSQKAFYCVPTKSRQMRFHPEVTRGLSSDLRDTSRLKTDGGPLNTDDSSCPQRAGLSRDRV